MHIHLVGVAGTGMGSLAGLLRKAGHRVTGSDTAFYPPMGEALARYGVETLTGYKAEHLVPAPDFVVIGNVCRKDNVEARAAIDGGLPYASFPGTMAKFFLHDRPSFVIAGTHGKTTTTALTSFLLHEAGRDPGFLIGGVPRDFHESYRLGAEGSPFVIEGDEYDSAFFEKTPKFWQYKPTAAILTSIEHDHIDIYPTEESYLEAFSEFVAKIPVDGLLVAYAGDANVRKIAKAARCKVRFYALGSDDCGDVSPEWLAMPAPSEGPFQPFDLFVGGSSAGRFHLPLSGEHNVRNAVASIGLIAEAANVPLRDLQSALARFGGVKRRQELLGVAHKVHVYDDFAHHPSAVRETLRGLRTRHPNGKLIAVFEPRSATASRKLHQDDYGHAFGDADFTILAPVGRNEIAANDKLDVAAVAQSLTAQGHTAFAPEDLGAVRESILNAAEPGDIVVLMSNGAFGGMHDHVLLGLTEKALAQPI